jgi:hypothetical protein
MAHAPTAVRLENGDGQAFLTLTHSEKTSMNGKGSENTRSIVVEGPRGSVVTCYDDQLFRLDQNSVTIAKIGDAPITVPIAADFVKGDLPEGIYRGRQPSYFWQLNKTVAETGNFWEGVWGDVETAANWLEEAAVWLAHHVGGGPEGGEDPEEDPSDEARTLTNGLEDLPNMQRVPNLSPGIVGYAYKGDSHRSTNNHVDNLSSIQLGDGSEKGPRGPARTPPVTISGSRLEV